MIYLLSITVNLLVQSRPFCLSPGCVCMFFSVCALRIGAAWSSHTHASTPFLHAFVFQWEEECRLWLSDIRLDAGHATVQPGSVAACARGSRCCHIAHWLRGSRWYHVGNHRRLLLGIEHLLVDMAAMLVDVMAAMVTEGKRQGHPLLIKLVGGTSMRHARGSLRGRISLCCARCWLEERVVWRTIRQQAFWTPGQRQRNIQTMVVGRGWRRGAAAAVRTVRAHCEHVGISPLIQGQLPVSVPVRKAQSP